MQARPTIVGKGFSPGENLIAATNVEFVLADGWWGGLAKGGAIKEDASCGAFNGTSKSHKGTLLLGKVWTFDLRISTGAE